MQSNSCPRTPELQVTQNQKSQKPLPCASAKGAVSSLACTRPGKLAVFEGLFRVQSAWHSFVCLRTPSRGRPDPKATDMYMFLINILQLHLVQLPFHAFGRRQSKAAVGIIVCKKRSPATFCTSRREWAVGRTRIALIPSNRRTYRNIVAPSSCASGWYVPANVFVTSNVSSGT